MVAIQQQILNDLDAVFLDGLQIDVIHTNGSTIETIQAFFDPEYSRLLEAGGIAVESDKPSILIRTEQADNINHSSSFEINSVTWYALEIESDNHGVKRIYLSKDQVS